MYKRCAEEGTGFALATESASAVLREAQVYPPPDFTAPILAPVMVGFVRFRVSVSQGCCCSCLHHKVGLVTVTVTPGQWHDSESDENPL